MGNTSKPDACARAVENVSSNCLADDRGTVLACDAVMLLRRQHTAIERLVRRLNQHWKVPAPGMDRYKYGYAEACEELLEALKARRG